MYIGIHAVTGAYIATVAPNPFFAIVVGFCSHLIMDIIPHYDLLPYEKQTANSILKNHKYKLLAVILIELILIAGVISLIAFGTIPYSTILLLTIIAAAWMDIIQLLWYAWPQNIIFAWFQKMHDIFHWPFDKPVSPFWGNLTQILTLGIFLFLILN